MTGYSEARRIAVIGESISQISGLDAMLAQSGFAGERIDGADLATVLATAWTTTLVVLQIDTTGDYRMLTSLRASGLAIPIILIGPACNDVVALNAFAAGADALLHNPVDSQELVTRCRALLRRSAAMVGSEPSAGTLSIDAEAKTAAVGASRLNLSVMQFAILEQLARRPGQVTTRQLLLDQLYGVDTPAPGVIDFYIHAIRRQLAASRSTTAIETVRGVGYRLVAKTS